MAIRGVDISGSKALFIGQPNGSYVSASNGDLTVTGNIVAKEFYTELVSASVVYSSGSNIFGDSQSDTHTFTGSLVVTGSVGIGTAAPAYQFVVKGPADNDGNIVADTTATSGGSSDGKLGLAKGGTIKWWLMNDGSQSDKFYIQDEGGSQAITVQQDGYVGIGTTSPSTFLEVFGGRIQVSGSGESSMVIRAAGSGDSYIPVSYTHLTLPTNREV